MSVNLMKVTDRRRRKMADKKTPLKPSRRPRPEDIRGAGSRAREFAERLRAKYPSRKFPDSAEIVREDRDQRN